MGDVIPIRTEPKKRVTLITHMGERTVLVLDETDYNTYNLIEYGCRMYIRDTDMPPGNFVEVDVLDGNSPERVDE